MPFCNKMICVYVSVCTWDQPVRKSSLTLIQFFSLHLASISPIRKACVLMQHPGMSLIVFDRRRWSWGNQLWQSRDKKKKKGERGSTSRTAWGSIYKRADKLSDFKKGSGLIKQPIVDAKQLQRSALPVTGSKRPSWCLWTESTNRLHVKRISRTLWFHWSAGLKEGTWPPLHQRFCRWHCVVASCH